MTRRTHIRTAARALLLGVLLGAAILPWPEAVAALPQNAPRAAAPAGHWTIVLPPVLVAGKPATLAVLDARGRPAASMTVNLEGGVTLITDETGRAAFTAPDSQGVLRAGLADEKVEASAAVIAAGAAQAPELRLDPVPRLLLLRDRFTVRGTGLSGIADENRVALAGQPAAVLAASPAALVALPNPNMALGETTLEVAALGKSASSGPVSVISFAVNSSKNTGHPGEPGEIRVGVTGTELPVSFEVRAQPAGRIEQARGNPSRARTTGGQNNGAKIEFTFRQPGEFFLEVRLVQQPLGLPDTEAAQRELEEARQLAPPGWTGKVDRVIKMVQKHPQDVAEARDAIEKMLAKKPAGEFGLRLEAAWKILLNRE